jgi:hypothetical protein
MVGTHKVVLVVIAIIVSRKAYPLWFSLWESPERPQLLALASPLPHWRKGAGIGHTTDVY